MYTLGHIGEIHGVFNTNLDGNVMNDLSVILIHKRSLYLSPEWDKAHQGEDGWEQEADNCGDAPRTAQARWIKANLRYHG